MTRKTAPEFETAPQPMKSNVIELFPSMRTKSPTIKIDDVYQGPVNSNELISIKALASFVAHNNNVSEEMAQKVVLTEFKSSGMTNLKRADYDRVIRFLVDLQLDITLIN